MLTLDRSALLLACNLVQVIGLVSAGLARICEGSKAQTSCQYLFLFCLALVGAAAFGSFSLEPGAWVHCGITLSLMVLAAVWDFRPADARIGQA